MFTSEYLNECFSYDPITGLFCWLVRPESHFRCGATRTASHGAAIWNGKFSGKPAFTLNHSEGYLRGSLSGRNLLAHRVAWAMHHGEWPAGEIDHINGDRTDNRIGNLRVVTRRENSRNLKVQSGEMRGVYWYAPTSRWVAKIHSKRRMLHLGYFKDLDAAIAARREAERKLGFHQNHGRVV